MATAKKAPAKKPAARAPTPAAMLKKVAAVADSNKALQKEMKAMAKIFAENQKVLVSMSGMVDSVVDALDSIGGQSRRIDAVEADAQRLYEGLKHARARDSLVEKLGAQTERMRGELGRIAELQKSSGVQGLAKQVGESADSIRNNSRMIIKIAQRIDELRDGLRGVSGKTDSLLEAGREIEGLKESVAEVAGRGAEAAEATREQLGRITEGLESSRGLAAEVARIKEEIAALSERAQKMDSLGGVIGGLAGQFEAVRARLEEAGGGSLAGKIDGMQAEIAALAKRADATAFVGEGLKSMQEDLAGFKQDVLGRTGEIEQRISSVSESLARQDALAAEFHSKAEGLFAEVRSARDEAGRASEDSSREMMALLRLSEFQSGIRMNSESKYGDASDLEKMASQTAAIVNLFDRVSAEGRERIPLPREVRQWAVSKMLDCADRWEVRFGDVYSILTNALGRDMLRESLRTQQVRDIYGIRAVDELRSDLGIP